MTTVSKAVFRRHLLNGGARPSGAVADRDPPARANVPLRIGIQKGSSLLLLHERGDLASVLRPLDFAPTFAVFPGGPRLLEAFNVGSVGLGHTSDAPTIFAQAAGAALVYVGTQPLAPEAEAIIVPSESSICSFAQLVRQLPRLRVRHRER